MRHNKFSEHGQALVVVALAAIVLFGFTALAIDGSAKLSDRRHAQNAADTAAIEAALTKVNQLLVADKNPGSISTTPATCKSTPSSAMVGASDVCVALVLSGLNRAASNGYDNITNNTVEIYSPPISGYYKDNTDYVQVIITSHVNTYFMRVLGIKQSDNIVQAVAYTNKGRTLGDGAMLIAYDPHPTCGSGVGSGGGSVDVSGSSTVNLTGGGIFVNSQETCGYATNCPPNFAINGGSINSAATVDNIDQSGCSNPAPENINQDPVVIPDDVFYPPVPPECSPTSTPANPTHLGDIMIGTKLTGEWLIYPGYYTDFPPNGLVGANKQQIYMASGVYCIDLPHGQSLSWSGTDATLLNGSTDPSKNKYSAYNPNGVTLYIKYSSGFALNSNNPTYLDATSSSSSAYKGYLIVMEGSSTDIQTCSITGGANINLNGMIFAPYCTITVNGTAGETAAINAQLLGWHITVNGNNAVNFTYNPAYKIIIKSKIGLMK
jgi:Flp pilus assembly protein TadG